MFDEISVHMRGFGGPRDYVRSIWQYNNSCYNGEIAKRSCHTGCLETKNDVWSIQEMMETIEREVEAREIGENMNRKQESVHSHSSTKKSFNDKPKTAAALHIKMDKTNIKCVYCGKNHFSSDCRTVADVLKRKEILKRNGRCFNCIGSGHMTRNCERKKKCTNCNGSHHQSICDKV